MANQFPLQNLYPGDFTQEDLFEVSRAFIIILLCHIYVYRTKS